MVHLEDENVEWCTLMVKVLMLGIVLFVYYKLYGDVVHHVKRLYQGAYDEFSQRLYYGVSDYVDNFRQTVTWRKP